MDNDTEYLRTPPPAMPRAERFDATGPTPNMAPVAYSEPEALGESKAFGGVFQRLVNDDGDIAGLVAYSIYKQNKLDWLRAFEATRGRAPDEAELTAYIIGEGTPRRLATYRHLAEATLTGHGPEIDGPRAPADVAARRRPVLAGPNAVAPGLVAVYAVIALVFVVGLWLALRFTVASH